jgi:hypothetical protein
MDVGDLFESLPKRTDGRLLITAWAACLVLLVLNLFTPAATALGLQSSGKWITLWATWPLVLFVGHIRLRTLFDGTEFVVLICHTLLIPGSVIFFIFKNLGAL